MDFRDRVYYQLYIRVFFGLVFIIVVVDIVDCNNYVFIFNRFFYEGIFDENIFLGISVLIVIVIDRDYGENGYVIYFIVRSKFVFFFIDFYLGIIFIFKFMDYEFMKRIYIFRVWVLDWGFLFCQEKEVFVFFRFRNLNDNRFMFEEVNCIVVICEDWFVGKLVMTVLVIDVDEFQNLKYEFVVGNALEYFDLNYFFGVIFFKRFFVNYIIG